MHYTQTCDYKSRILSRYILTLFTLQQGIIVIHPGSWNLRIGLAADVDEKPLIVPHCIAYRISQPQNSNGANDSATDAMDVDGQQQPQPELDDPMAAVLKVRVESCLESKVVAHTPPN